MAKRPVPMIPNANKYLAALPASGSSAIAACSAVPTVVMPAAPSVAAEVTMMANMTSTPDDIPATTSPRMARNCPTASPSDAVRSPSCFNSSTSSLVCQKKRYGEMVVPKSAINAAIAVLLKDKPGEKILPTTSAHDTSIINRTAMYDSSDTHSQRNTREYW
jgi:hypothetical protein